MSITSLAEDSTLRLAAAGKVTTSRLPRTVTVTEASEAAAQAAVERALAPAPGTPPESVAESAVAHGKQAAREAVATVPSTPPSSGPLGQLVRYIPTETLTFYVAIQGALGNLTPGSGGSVCNASFRSRWIWVGVVFVATVALAVGLSYRSQRNASTGAFTFKPPVFEPLAAGAAFLVWAFTLPSTPLLDFCGYDVSAWNGVVLLGGTIVIASVGYVLGLSVSWQKVLDDDSAPAQTGSVA